MTFEEAKRLKISYLLSVLLHLILVLVIGIQWNNRPKLDQFLKLPEDIKFELIYEEPEPKEEIVEEKIVEEVAKASTDKNKEDATYTGKEAETAVLGSTKSLSKREDDTQAFLTGDAYIVRKEIETETDPISRTCYEAGYEVGHVFGTGEKKEGLPYKAEIKWNEKKPLYQEAIDLVVRYRNMREERVTEIFREGWINGYKHAYYGVAKEKTWLAKYK